MDAFYIAHKGVKYGPFTETQIKELITQGWLLGTDMMWFTGQSAWLPAKEVVGAWFSAASLPPPLPAMTPPPIPQQPIAAVAPALPVISPPSEQLGATTRASNLNAPFGALNKHVESLKTAIDANQRIDPKLNSLSQVVQPLGSAQVRPNDAEHDFEDGPDGAEHDDEK